MLQIKQFTKIYKNGKGIKKVDMEIKPGDIIGLVGDNGAGKSTFIKSFFGEITPDSGESFIDGHLIKPEDMKNFSFFPDNSVMPKGVTIYEYAMHAAAIAGIEKNSAKIKIDKMLECLKLTEFKKKTFSALSAGMQKKALIVISLITSPKYIFFDEPTANLDVHNRTELINLILALSKIGIGILITSHIIEELQSIITKLIIMKDGEIVYNENLDNNLESIKSIYFENAETEEKIRYKQLMEILSYDI